MPRRGRRWAGYLVPGQYRVGFMGATFTARPVVRGALCCTCPNLVNYIFAKSGRTSQRSVAGVHGPEGG